MTEQPLHIWFDGSYRQKGALGVAWAWKEGGKFQVDSRAVANGDLKDYEEHGSHYVELVACFHALKSLPDQSVVVAHTDSQDLINWMTIGQEVFTRRKTKDRAALPPLKKAFEHTLAQKDRMRSVTWQLTADKNNEGMQLVHEAAQTAST
ncbi:MAG TPA: hypothetical protein VIN59_05575, partial [Alphaproteobacteria bacterium]